MLFQRIIDFSQSTIKIINDNFELVQRKLNEGFNGTTDIKPGTITEGSIQNGSITSLKIGTGEITTALIKDLSADSANIHDLVVQTVTAGEITTKKLTVGDAFIDSLAVNEAFIDKLEVKAANIKDLNFEMGEGGQLILDQSHIKIASIDGAIIEEGTVNTIQIADASITDAKIVELNAGKIKTGTLDASLITVKNLHADSITAGEIKIVGHNLLPNSRFLESSNADNYGWNFRGNYVMKRPENNTVIISKETNDDVWNGITLYGTFVPVQPETEYIFQIEAFKDDDKILEDEIIEAMILLYDKDNVYIQGYSMPVKVETATPRLEYYKHYEKFVLKFTTPDTAAYFGIQVGGTTVQNMGLAKPMLYKGILEMPYTPKPSETFIDGELEGKVIVANSITSEKIAANSITANHIMTNELKAAIVNINEAFINSAQIINIDAAKITTGTMTADRIKGGTLELGGAAGGKMIMFDGEGEEVGRWDATSGEFSSMKVGEIEASNVISHQTSKYIYVNSSTGNDSNPGYSSSPKKTIKAALDMFNKHLLGAVTLNLSGTFNEDVYIEGFSGPGKIGIVINDPVTINGYFLIQSCSCVVEIIGKSSSNIVVNSNYNYGLMATSSSYVFLRYMVFNCGTNCFAGIYSNQGSTIVVRDTSVNNCTGWAGAFYCSSSKLHSWTTKGSNNTRAVYLEIGAIITLGGSSRPVGAISKGADSILTGETLTAVNGDGSATVPTVVSKSYSATAFKSYRSIDGWATSKVYQGNYSGKSGYNYFGCYVIPASTIKTDFAGKTAKSITLTLKRANSGGTSAAISLNLYGTTSSGTGGQPALTKSYGVVGTATRNQTITVSIPNAVLTDILNSGINSLMLHQSSGSNYGLMENIFTLKIDV